MVAVRRAESVAYVRRVGRAITHDRHSLLRGWTCLGEARRHSTRVQSFGLEMVFPGGPAAGAERVCLIVTLWVIVSSRGS